MPRNIKHHDCTQVYREPYECEEAIFTSDLQVHPSTAESSTSWLRWVMLIALPWGKEKKKILSGMYLTLFSIKVGKHLGGRTFTLCSLHSSTHMYSISLLCRHSEHWKDASITNGSIKCPRRKILSSLVVMMAPTFSLCFPLHSPLSPGLWEH